ncbi:hypothetical protein B0H13DRAFT_1946352 [Mycena leptocephala]|nr:hypothetical protein B0H13DRAFT_1946352 [Mycena leptocephala]
MPLTCYGSAWVRLPFILLGLRRISLPVILWASADSTGVLERIQSEITPKPLNICVNSRCHFSLCCALIPHSSCPRPTRWLFPNVGNLCRRPVRVHSPMRVH